MIHLITLLLFLCSGAICHASETFNIETLSTFRTKQYPLNPYQKIVVFSASRTGSSLLYNIFNFLFEDWKNLSSAHNDFNENYLVLKTHKFTDLKLLQANVLYVIPIRNPIDAIISNYRICPRKITSLDEFVKNLKQRHVDYLTFFEKLQKEGSPAILLKYEQFTEDLDSIFDLIETHFSISIADVDKEMIKRGYSKENVHAATEKFDTFSQALPISGFHGKHVCLEKYVPPDELLFWLNRYLPDIAPAFRNYGYFLD